MAGAVPPLLVLGDSTVPLLLHRTLAERALEGPSQVVLDCGGFFDPYLLAREARRQGLRPEAVLERIHVARAFTGYQEIRALLDLRRRFGRGHPVYLLNPLFPLRDEDLPEGDRRWLFRRLLAGVDYYSRAGYPLRLCQEAGRGSAALLQTLARRLPVLLAARGHLLGVSDGQERSALFPGAGAAGEGVRPLSPLPEEGRPDPLRHAV